VLDLTSNCFNFVCFFFDFFLTSFGNLNFEESHLFFPGFWDITDFDVFFKCLFEFLNFFFKFLTFLRFLEGFNSSSDGMSLLVVESSFPGSCVSLVPLRAFKGIIFSSDIGKLILKSIQVSVVNVDFVLSVVENFHFFKNFTNIRPLFNEFLSFFGCQEFLVKLFDSENLLGFSPSLQRVLEVSDWLGVSDVFSLEFNIGGLLGDNFLSILRDFDLESIDSISKLLNLEIFGADDTEEKGKGEFHTERWFVFDKKYL